MVDLLDEDVEQVGFTDAPSEAESLSLAELGRKLWDAEREITLLEARLKAAKDERRQIQMKDLPEKMVSLGQNIIGLRDDDGVGVVLELKPYYHANIAADWDEAKRDAAFQYLIDGGNEDLIKVQLTMQFSRREYDLALWLRDQLQRFVPPPDLGAVLPHAQVSYGVPWNTLTAFVREQVERKQPIDLDVLGAEVGMTVKIKEQK